MPDEQANPKEGGRRKRKSLEKKRSRGTLYVVSTPIGNLEDITLRALRILKEVDKIAAERVAHTRALCSHYGIKTKLTSYHQHNQKTKTGMLIKALKMGQDIAVVTDAGTPGISDPGVYLIDRAAEEKISVVPIPGPSAVIGALSIAGFPTESFLFLGFLPNKPGKRKRELKKLLSEPRTTVFFEAPHRIRATLEDVREILGERNMVLVRELTKLYEEVRRGSASTILEDLEEREIRGEFTLVMAGSKGEEKVEGLSAEIQKRIGRLLTEGEGSIKGIAKLVSDEQGLPYRRIYRECLAMKKAQERFKVDGLGEELEDPKQIGLTRTGRSQNRGTG